MSGPTKVVQAEFRVLGPLRVVVDGSEVEIATRRQRALLVLLLMNVGRVVPAERLIDQLWDGAPPPQAGVTLRSYVSNLRQALGGRDGLGGSLTTRGSGYCLDVPPATVDAVNLGLLADRGRELLRAGKPDEAMAAFDMSVRSWSGDPLAEIADHQAAQSTVIQLTETYLGAVEGRFQALLSTGRHVDALPALEAFVADHPLREEARALLMLCLYRAGRAAEALEVHRRFREHLRDELGIDPSARLDRLQQMILEQDPELDPPPGVAPQLAGSAEERSSEVVQRGPVLVGRDRELAALDGHLMSLARSGRGSLVLVGGEPGIGKTTLLESLEASARRHGIAVHRGRAPAAHGVPAFWPWTQVVESLASGLDDAALARATAGAARPVTQLSALIAERIGHDAPMTGQNVQSLRYHLYEAVSVFVRQASDNRPVVILLDDLHWADRPSLELLSYLTPSLEARPLLVVGAYRDLPADRTDALADTLATVSREDTASELALTGLALEDVATLSDQLLGTEPVSSGTNTEVAALLHARTGGNPFFVRQLARLMVESNTDLSVKDVPSGVQHVIASRLKGLSEQTRELLAAAAVVGRDFELAAAAAGAGLTVEESLDAYDDAAGHGLLEPSRAVGTRRFVHALVQEVVLHQLPAGRAARLHASVARYLHQHGTASPEQLAEHHWAARDILAAGAIESQLAAAAASERVLAYERGEVYLRRALELARTGGPANAQTELTVLFRLFRLITTARGWGDEEVRAVVDRALELTETRTLTDETARLWWSLFHYLLDRGDRSYVDVVDTLTSSLADGPGDRVGPAARANIHLCALLADLDRDERESARSHLEQAHRHVQAASHESLAAYDEHLHVMLLVTDAYWAALHGDAAAHRRSAGAAIALADADGRPFPRAVARTLGVAGAPYLGDPSSHRDLARSALELSERFGFGWLTTLASCLVAWADAHDGASPEQSAETITAVLEELRREGRRGNISSLLLMLADVRLVQGRREDARAALVEAARDPGPYRGLVLDVLERRLSQLG